MKTSTALVITGFGLVVAGAGIAGHQITQLRRELAEVRQQIEVGQAGTPLETRRAVSAESARETTWRRASSDGGVDRRLDELERSLAQLTRASEYLMERGQIPLGGEKKEELIRLVGDGNASDAERMRALGLLRRSNGMNDEVVQHALNWLQAATNAGTRRTLVQQLGSVTNVAVKAPLLALMTSEKNNAVREEVAQSLQRFADDPQVESALWSAALNDPDGDVREEASDALRDGPISPERIAKLRERALNPASSLDEQLMAFDTLRHANAPTTDLVASMANMAQQTGDAMERIKLFRAFDNVNDPATKVPLLYGLQDNNAMVREEAADALSNFSTDPAVREWLQFVANNDADPTVRREAFQALSEENRARRQ